MLFFYYNSSIKAEYLAMFCKGIMENNTKNKYSAVKKVWVDFAEKHNLTPQQVQQFERYFLLLQAWNRRTNITRITSEPAVVADHFHDSLSLSSYVNLEGKKGVCDIGSGGGFPGVPLAIVHPTVSFVLLEVNQKKCAFLQEVIKELHLDNCQVCDLDWRTFLRQAPYELDLFLARASLKPAELVRMFKPSCAYKDAECVYWASRTWEPRGNDKNYIIRKEAYDVGGKKRCLVFFKSKEC